MPSSELEDRAINTIRFLAADAVQKANSGHPGLPMGTAVMAYAIWMRHLKFDPLDPRWVDRDRFVLSAGHGSMLLYALLHLTGFDLPIEEIKQFRQWGSLTPGHPEFGLTPGVEATTGPLGQGFGNGVGMAIAAEHLAAAYNREEINLVDHHVFAIVSDGDLMEGIASEAASLAGHLKLGRLIYLYDDNHITIDGNTSLAFTEDRAARFKAYGWHTIFVADGNDLDAIDKAIIEAKQDPRPSLILCRTQIGYGLPNKQGTAAAHGEPPGEEELQAAKENLQWPLKPSFLVPDDVREHFMARGHSGKIERDNWAILFAKYRDKYPELARKFERTQSGDLPVSLGVTTFSTDEKGMATRASSGQVLNSLATQLPELIGGSADLTGSNKTDIRGEVPFSAHNRQGRYIHFGVREHAMGAILNGIALHGGLIPYGGTFLIFSDYMRPSIRLAALMGIRVIYVFTHDSIGLGEDGPTHQPIEHLAALRAIPNLTLIRPADANEVAFAWLAALENVNGPVAFSLTRQSLPTINRERFASADGIRKGAYILEDIGSESPELILMASGSEVELIIQAAETIAKQGVGVRIVSFPSWELFAAQDKDYQQSVLPDNIPARIAVEAGLPMGWERWVGGEGKVIGITRFGASAPYLEIYRQYGLTVENITDTAIAILKRTKAKGQKV